MSDLSGEDIEHAGILDADNIPNDNQSHQCFSCKQVFTGIYCNGCGQKNDNYRRSLFSLLIELGGTLTAIEGRIWRTWGALLFKPGKVAREYADGARTKWSSPIRTYLAMSLILFGFLALTNTHIISFDVNVKPKDGITKPRADLTAEDLSFESAIHMLERQSEIDARNATRDFELIKRKMLNEDGSLRIDLDIGEEDEADLNEAIEDAKSQIRDFENQENTKINANGRSIVVDDNGQISVDGKPIEGRRISEFVFDFMQNPAVVTDSFRIFLPRLLFFMMPITMFIGAIFIRGRNNAMLYDHIIHAAYIHSVVFFLLLLGILASYVLPGSLVGRTIFIVLLLYLPLSLKRMFGRGWFKTIWTSYGVGFIYSIILFTGLCVILVKTLSDAAS